MLGYFTYKLKTEKKGAEVVITISNLESLAHYQQGKIVQLCHIMFQCNTITTMLIFIMCLIPPRSGHHSQRVQNTHSEHGK